MVINDNNVKMKPISMAVWQIATISAVSVVQATITESPTEHPI